MTGHWFFDVPSDIFRVGLALAFWAVVGMATLGLARESWDWVYGIWQDRKHGRGRPGGGGSGADTAAGGGSDQVA
jgi:hypothetical protein